MGTRPPKWWPPPDDEWIGDERANELEQVEDGLVDEFEDVQAFYRQVRSEERRERLRAVTIKKAMALTGLS